MPSFNCDGCGDVVKKPKLDSHSMRCRSSVTCLDCSTTFNSPAEWKNHTSCISEAQKYQKSLFKPPKTNNKKAIDEQQASLKNKPPTSLSVTPITPSSTNPNPNHDTHAHDKPTEPTKQPDEGSNQLPKPNQKSKKKDKKRNDQTRTQGVVSDEKESAPVDKPTDEPMNPANATTNPTSEDVKHKKKTKAGPEEPSQMEGHVSSSSKKKRKRNESKNESTVKAGEEEEEESVKPTEQKSEKKTSKKQKKKINEQVEINGDVETTRPELLAVDRTAILEHSKKIILASNGQPIKLRDMITSYLKSILDKNPQPTHHDLPKNEQAQLEQGFRSQIQEIFLENLQFAAQQTDDHVSLTWNNGPF